MADAGLQLVYLKVEKNVEVHRKQVQIMQVAQVYCSDRTLQQACKKMVFFRIPPEKDEEEGRYVFSVLKIVKKIEQSFSGVQVICLGETDFIVDYRPPKRPKRCWERMKVVFVAGVAFVGGAFAIMTFNNDGDVLKVFGRMYELIMGRPSDGRTLLELGYAIGVPVGITVFFNHFSGKHFTQDPTPIEVEMRLYEEDVDTTLIQNANRLGREAE
ncbi:MAG: stage V sporulation protein AA [Lachnospiraceae bacterium]|nr:stage V sporulation protein AA [Lachnospiraceae bacterium]